MSKNYQIVYWRDIPAQIKMRSGRERIGRELSERFHKAIDWAAMAAGATSTDGYLEEWRSTEWIDLPAEISSLELPDAAERLLQQLEADYPAERLQALMTNKGFQR